MKKFDGVSTVHSNWILVGVLKDILYLGKIDDSFHHFHMAFLRPDALFPNIPPD